MRVRSNTSVPLNEVDHSSITPELDLFARCPYPEVKYHIGVCLPFQNWMAELSGTYTVRRPYIASMTHGIIGALSRISSSSDLSKYIPRIGLTCITHSRHYRALSRKASLSGLSKCITGMRCPALRNHRDSWPYIVHRSIRIVFFSNQKCPK